MYIPVNQSVANHATWPPHLFPEAYFSGWWEDLPVTNYPP